jgi:hypothetical protein
MVGPAASPLRIEGPSGSIKFGLLAQPQYEAVGAPAADAITENIYLRRIRVLLGGTLLKYFDYFFETDYPNLFKSAPVNGASLKNSPGLNVQDALVTYKPLGDLVKIDAGFMLPPLAHNAVQSAATLYGWDYFANTFRSTASFGNAPPDPVGRDLGIEARGLLFDGHLEYRAGLFQGRRNDPEAAMPPAQPTPKLGGRNFFRVAARIQVNVLDPEPGFFYAGTYLGAKRIVSIGAAYDFQDDYKYWALDGFVDVPAGPGVVTAQVNLVEWDGGTFLPALLKQTALMAEAGYLLADLSLSPILRYERRWYPNNSTTVTANEDRYVGGLAFWPFGHNSNVKAFYSRIHPDPALHDYDQFNLQWQVFFY